MAETEHDHQAVELSLAKRQQQLKEIATVISLLNNIEVDIVTASLLVREHTPSGDRFARRLTIVNEEIESIKSDMHRRYL